MTQVWCELALIDGRPEPSVLIDMIDGRFASIAVGVSPGDATRLGGFTVPGLANAHSHSFHRALRSRTQSGPGSFWTWRELMYRAAERLQPDSCHRLARAVFAEMAMAGVSCVGEFHYLHHQLDGTPYDAPNAMGEALLAAATDAGIRITLLDTVYLHGGLGPDGHTACAGVQRRFADATADAWIDRTDQFATSDSIHNSDTRRIGAAIHSVRAVDPEAMKAVAEWSGAHGIALHAHVSEQVAENESCAHHHGVTPTQLLADVGALSDRFCAVHATHVDDSDIELLASAASMVVMCPTTERDLGDGIGPTRSFAASGVGMALGSDSHAMIDLFEESRAVELDERLRSRERGIHSASDLLAMATVNGHRSLGWDGAGSISVGNRADLVTIATDSIRTAGTPAHLAVEATVFAATAADVRDVHVDGRHIVADGHHRSIDAAAELDAAIRELMDDA